MSPEISELTVGCFLHNKRHRKFVQVLLRYTSCVNEPLFNTKLITFNTFDEISNKIAAVLDLKS